MFVAVLVAIPAVAVVLFGAVEAEHVLPVEIAALGLGAAALLARTRRGDRPLPAPRLTLPVLGLTALAVLQLVPLPGRVPPWLGRPEAALLRSLSVFPAATYLALLRWLAYGAYLIAALEILRRPGAVRAALGAVAALGVAEAVYGIGNLLLGNAHLLWLRREVSFLDATGTLVNRNHYAALLELCLPVLLARRWLARRPVVDARGLTALTVIGGGVMGLALLLSHSRAGVVGLVLALTLTAALGPPDADGRPGRRVVLALGGVVLLAGAWVGLEPIVSRFAQLAEPTGNVRPSLWSDTLGLARDFPLTGAGAGTFEGIFPAYRHATTDQAAYAHAHQDYLELAAEGGIAAMALVLAAAWGFASLVGPALRRGSDRSLPLAALLGALAAVLAHAAVDFPFHIPGLTFLFLLVAAATLVVAEAVTRRPKKST
jgi:O-antigen ligase